MRKVLAFLLCLITVCSLISCKNSFGPNGLDIKKDPSEKAPDYSDILNLYKKILIGCATDDMDGDALGITDPYEKELFADLSFKINNNYVGTESADRLSPIHMLHYGYSQKDINGDGIDELVLMDEDYEIIALFSYADGKPIMIGGPTEKFPDKRPYLPNCWIDGDGLIHASPQYGFDRYMMYRIADGGASLETIADFGLILYAGGITKYYSYASGEDVEITKDVYDALYKRYGKLPDGKSSNETTREYSGLRFVPLFSEAELVEIIYRSVLDNETKVYNPDTEEYTFLKRCRTTYDKAYLCDVPDLKYAFVDLDGDGVGEPVIECGDTLVLRYYNRRVYVYSFTFRQAYDLKTDGTYSWNATDERFEYGTKKICFDGAELKTKDLWRVVDDGEPDAEYYIDGERTTREEIEKYIAENQKAAPEFFTVDESWYYTLSSEEAYEIAKDRILFNGEGGGAAGTTIIPKLLTVAVPDGEDIYYHVVWIDERYNHNIEGWETGAPYSIRYMREVLVDEATGECTVIELNQECEIYEMRALRLAEQYWGIADGSVEGAMGSTIINRIVIELPHCGSRYYRVLLNGEYYNHNEEGWESRPPYMTETFKTLLIDIRTGECLEESALDPDAKG